MRLPWLGIRWPTVLLVVWVLVGVTALLSALLYINLANYATVGCDTTQLHVPLPLANACWMSYEHGYFLGMLLGGAAWCAGFVVLSLVWLMAWAHRMELSAGDHIARR